MNQAFFECEFAQNRDLPESMEFTRVLNEKKLICGISDTGEGEALVALWA